MGCRCGRRRLSKEKIRGATCVPMHRCILKYLKFTNNIFSVFFLSFFFFFFFLFVCLFLWTNRPHKLKNNEKVFINVVCCSHDNRLKGQYHALPHAVMCFILINELNKRSKRNSFCYISSGFNSHFL